jgi:Kef-type K+ transport system membrane component KefB
VNEGGETCRDSPVETHTFFLHLFVVLIGARVLAELAVRLRAPSVLGELAAGVALGPSLLGWIEPENALKLMAEIGVILLLFEVGLETDVNRLIRTGGKSLVVALAGFVTPFLLGFALSRYLFGLPLLQSLFIGGTLTATSIGITVRVLSDLRRQTSAEGQVVLGAAVLDDVLGVILLAVLYEFSLGGGVSAATALKVLVFVAAFFLLAPAVAKLMAVLIKRFEQVSEIPGMIPTMVVSLVLFFAWLAHVAGAPELLGGFAAGLALSRRFFLPLGLAMHSDPVFARRVENRVTPIVHLFTPIFFVMVGLSLNLREVEWASAFVWAFSLALLLAAVAGKMLGALLLREARRTRIVIGLAMIPRGEVGLVFAELGRVNEVYGNDIYASLVFVIALTTLLPPFAMKWLYARNEGPGL